MKNNCEVSLASLSDISFECSSINHMSNMDMYGIRFDSSLNIYTSHDGINYTKVAKGKIKGNSLFFKDGDKNVEIPNIPKKTLKKLNP